MKRLLFYYLSAVLLLATSCKEDNEKMPDFHLGTVSYYPSFLWCKSQMSALTKSMVLDFSDDAQADKNCFVEMAFVDVDKQRLSPKVLKMELNGTPLEENNFRIASDIHELELTFSFSPEATAGKYQGYLQLVNHNLDRFENQIVTPGETVEVSKWSITFDKQWNPLFKWLLAVVVFVLSLLLLWFIFLRPILYPHFRKTTKTLVITENNRTVGLLKVSFGGKLRVVISDKRIPQSCWSKLFIGEVYYVVHPLFKTPLIFKPASKKRIYVAGAGYRTTPNPLPKFGVGEIMQQQQNIKITIK